MPNLTGMMDNIASQMMKSGRIGNLKATEKQKVNFLKRHEKQIKWTAEHLPRYSSAVAAVIVKCMIKYNDYDKIKKLCNSLKNGLFNGADDPAFVLWKFLENYKTKDPATIYWFTVCGAKAYMEDSKILKLRRVNADIFDWDIGWTVPDNLLHNWNPNTVPLD